HAHRAGPRRGPRARGRPGQALGHHRRDQGRRADRRGARARRAGRLLGRLRRRDARAAHRRRHGGDPAQHGRRPRARPAAGAALRQGRPVQRAVRARGGARMNFALSDEQVMLREAAANALSRFDGVAAARAAADGAEPHDIWPLAGDAGWTGLLVTEEHGGAGLGAFDAMLVMEECGRRLTGTGLLGHLLATHVLDDDPALAAGEQRAALAPARPPAEDEGWTVERRGDGRGRAPAPRFADGQVTGEVAYVPDLAGADVIVVVCEGPVAVAVDGGAVVERVVRYDNTRPLGHAVFDGTPARALDADPERLASAWYLAQALLAADALGGCQAMLEMGVAYAKERHAFGRPIGSYQA